MEILNFIVFDEKQLVSDVDFRAIFDNAPIIKIDNHGANRLKAILKLLPNNTNIFIWIHIGEVGRNTTKGINTLKRFKNELKGINKENTFFASRSSNKDLPRGYNPHNDNKIHLLADILDSSQITPFSPNDYLYPPSPSVEYQLVSNSRINLKNEKYIGEETLEKIVGGALKELEPRMFNNENTFTGTATKVNFLSPGYSGAKVFTLSYNKKNTARKYLIKISKDQKKLELEIASAKEISRNLKNGFISTETNPFYTEGYLGISFRYKNYHDLSYYLSKSSDHNQLNDSKVINILKKFKSFEKEIGETTLYNSNPWYDKNHGIKPDKNTIQKIENELNALLNLDEDYLEKYKLSKKAIEKLVKFINKNPKERNDKDDTFLIYYNIDIPTSYVHGDLHTGNILVNNNIEDPYFIDYGITFLDQKENGLLDLGKLATSIEITIIPSNKLSGKESISFYENWIDAHKAFLEKTFDSSKNRYNTNIEDILKKTYKIQEAINFYTAKEFGFYERENKTYNYGAANIIFQYHLVRLKYFLELLGYGTLIREKLLFLTKASIDIIDKLKEMEKEIYP